MDSSISWRSSDEESSKLTSLDERHAFGAAVELVEEGRVRQRAGGDLGQAVEKVEALEPPAVVVVDPGDPDDLAAADERELEHRPVPPAQILVPLEVAHARVGGDVVCADRLPGLESHAREAQLGDGVLRPDVPGVGVAVVDTGDAADDVAVHGEDVAVGRVCRRAEAAGDALEDLVPVQRRPELDAALHEQAERLVAVLEAFHEQRVLEGSCHHLADAEQEVAVLRVVPPPVVVDVEQADDALVEHERDADLALGAGLAIEVALEIAEARVVRALDHERRLRGDGLSRAREQGEVERPVAVVVEELAALVGEDAVKSVSLRRMKT